jgi:tetratricopeptide (TPR) repeat protein
MKRRWVRFLGLGVVLTVGVWVLAKPIMQWLRIPPRLISVVKAIESRQFDLAEKQLNQILTIHPDHAEAHMLMAQVMTERPNSKPTVALEHLRRVHSSNPKRQAHMKVFEGKVWLQSRYLAKAESAWIEALRLDPQVPEAGWLLLQNFSLQSRDLEAHTLALKLFAIEPDPRDRVGLLLELIREDVERLAAAGLIPLLAPAVANDPDDWRSGLALGRALVREGHTREGIKHLRDVLARRNEDLDVWDAFLTSLGDGGDIDALATEWARVPKTIASHPRLAQHAGRIALERRDYSAAVTAFQAALANAPTDTKIMHRLGRALRYAGKSAEAERIDVQERVINATLKELKDLYRQANATKTSRLHDEKELYQRFATLLERLGKYDEALAWHQLVLRSSPNETISRTAVARLKTSN